MQSFMDLVRQRYSLRSYSTKAVEKEKIERCLEAARLAPSACNAQPWHFIVADEAELVQKIRAACLLPGSRLNSFTASVPVFIAVVGEKPNLSAALGSVVKNKPFYLIDLGIAAEHICLQAADEGLGSCMLGWFDEKKVKKLLGIPSAKRLPLLISLGYPPDDKTVPEKRRKTAKETTSWNLYTK